MYKLQLWESHIGSVCCVRSSLTAVDNCGFMYTFLSGLLCYAALCVHITRHLSEASLLQNHWIHFYHWNFHALFLPGYPQSFVWVIKFYSSSLARSLLPFLHFSSQLGWLLIMLLYSELFLPINTAQYGRKPILSDCQSSRICVTPICNFIHKL